MAQHFTILVAEDEPNDALLIRRALNKIEVKLETHIVGDGDELIAYLKGEGNFKHRDRFPFPKIVITDLKMPKCNGLEALAWIRNQSRFRSIPVVLLSSSVQPSDLRKASELGATSYFVKPTCVNELRRLLEKTVDYWMNNRLQPCSSEA